MALPTEQLLERAKRIRLVIFDVDGVLTDGRMTYGPNGEATKTFHVRDGHGIVLLRLAGLQTAILSARNSEIVRTRMRELGVKHLVLGERDKTLGLARILEATDVSADQAAFIGDDVNDVPVFPLVGLSACPADAAAEARERADFVTSSGGGQGAARELCELVLKAQDLWKP